MNTAQSYIPWYRTRWFWGVIIGVLITWGLVFYFVLLPPGNSFVRIIQNIALVFGAAPLGLFGSNLFGSIGGKIFTTLYFIIMILLIYKIFNRPKVNILYPIIFVAIYILGSFVGIGYLSGL